MILTDLLIWILVCYGITVVVTGSTIMAPIREKSWNLHKKIGELLECPMCFGFWSGLLVSLFWASPTNNLLFDGFLASGTCWLIHTWEESKLT